jgi:hypothetical protein
VLGGARTIHLDPEHRTVSVRTFSAVIERCPDAGLLVGCVPGFPGAHIQEASLDELQEVIAMLWKTENPRLRPTLLACSRSVFRLEMGSVPVLKP